MFDYKTNDGAVLRSTLGVWITPGYGKAYPELKASLLRMYRDKVSKMNFVPAGWISDVEKVQEAHPDDLVRIAPALNGGGSIIMENAAFTRQSKETAEAWHAMFKVENRVITTTAFNQAKAGQAELDILYRNAVFWNRIYQIGSAVGVVQLQAGITGAKEWWEDNDKRIMYIGIGVAVLAALWVLTPYISPFLRRAK